MKGRMKDLQLLDCTLRDGGYIKDWEFGHDTLVNVFERTVSSGVDIIEVGFLDNRREGKTHNNWYSLFDAAMLSFTSYTKVGMRITEYVGFTIAALSFLLGPIYLITKLVNWYGFTAGHAPTMITFFHGRGSAGLYAIPR